MYVQDVRLPMQPAVPIVQAPPPGTTATNTGKATEDPRLVWGGGRATRRGLGFSVLDRALIHAVTGENVEMMAPADLSAFSRQILTDRGNGRLPAGREIDVDYLYRTGRRLAGLGDANPFAGALLQRALQFVQGREGGRLDLAL